MNTLKNLFLFIASCLNTALSDIATIKSKVSDSGVVTINRNFCKYVKKNGYVFVFGDSPFLSGNTTVNITVGSEYKTVGTLPVALRPSNSVYFTPTSKGGTADFIGLIDTDGSVSLYSTTATPYWGYSVMFPIEDA